MYLLSVVQAATRVDILQIINYASSFCGCESRREKGKKGLLCNAPALHLTLQNRSHALQVLAQRTRWTEGYQPPTNSVPANDSTQGSTTPAATTLASLLEYQDPKSGLTPLMAAVVKGYLSVARQVHFGKQLRHLPI